MGLVSKEAGLSLSLNISNRLDLKDSCEILALSPQSHGPQNPSIGEKEVWYSSRLLMEGADAQTLSEGETVTLIHWGNVVVTKLSR